MHFRSTHCRRFLAVWVLAVGAAACEYNEYVPPPAVPEGP
jgi:hypothetical protein